MDKMNFQLHWFSQGSQLWKPIRQCLGKFMALEKLEHTYKSLVPAPSIENFLKDLVDRLGIRPLVQGDVEAIPAKEPLIVVANHPFGGLEGILAAKILLTVRSDVKIMANFLLERIPEMNSLIFGVDPFGRKESRDRNILPLRRCLEWIQKGGVLVVFPSGTVSHFHLRNLAVLDPPWNSTVGRLVLRTQCSVLPMHFNGSNSLSFHLLGLLHPNFRTLLLPRELQNKIGRTIHITIGKKIPFEELTKIGSAEGITEYLRASTYALGLSQVNHRSKIFFLRTGWMSRRGKSKQKCQPISNAIPETLVEKEVEDLPTDQCLFTSGHYKIFWASASQIPNLLLEIGRLREITFRTAGEGSGKSVDLDRFDLYYDHLFVWNQKTREVVGAYRIGRGDVILDQRGLKGFYTQTLFRYDQGIEPLLEKSLELGRSFVRPEYQKEYVPLWFLWRGIGRYVSLHGHYRYLIGPVSISDKYHTLSRHLIVMYLRHHHFSKEWGAWVRPRRPWRYVAPKPWDINLLCNHITDMDLLGKLVSTIEGNSRAIPVLLRHYIKLGGKVLSFSVDPKFSNVLDTLILVNLSLVEPSFLEKTMGREEAHKFLLLHQNA
ncbi:MAG: GNAT family N-acyltransferase [Thermodesulforhabdaceae bacterium]